MKLKYLSEEDRRDIRALRHISDVNEIADVLDQMLHRSFTVQALWEYRKWFDMLGEEQLQSHPALAVGVMQCRILRGDLAEARKFLESLPPDHPYLIFCKMVLPGLPKEELFELIRKSKEIGISPVPNMTLTAARPTVINGVWDMTPMASFLKGNKEEAIELLTDLFGTQAESIYEICMAEHLYWRDDCYNALLQTVSVIPFLKERQDMRLLFAALTLEIYVLVLNAQTPSAAPMMKNLRQQMHHAELDEYLPNIVALEAWMAMYDGDYVQVTKWLREDAPDEYGRFCMLDVFRYMVKIRAYIISEKYLSVTALAGRLLPLLEEGERYMDCCELLTLWAISDFSDGREPEAFERIEKALALAERYSYDRLLADEGVKVHELLVKYRKTCPKSGDGDYLKRIIKLSERTASLHPRYLRKQLPESPALTETELRVLRLLAECHTNAQIAEITGTSLDNIKKHCKNINAKLCVRSRHQAVQRATEYGILNPS